MAGKPREPSGTQSAIGGMIGGTGVAMVANGSVLTEEPGSIVPTDSRHADQIRMRWYWPVSSDSVIAQIAASTDDGRCLSGPYVFSLWPAVWSLLAGKARFPGFRADVCFSE
jgi:hypothetical protein